jgi:hypothetical protein
MAAPLSKSLKAEHGVRLKLNLTEEKRESGEKLRGMK